MRRFYLFLLFGCSFYSLFGDVKFQDESSSKITIQIAPYVYANIADIGYGVTFRGQMVGHTLEIAPIMLPAANWWSYWNDGRRKKGFISSYYYAFFRNKSFQPYLGLTYYSPDHLTASLIGIQFCNPKGKPRSFPGFVFLDVQGPVFYQYKLQTSVVFPRFGLGLNF